QRVRSATTPAPPLSWTVCPEPSGGADHGGVASGIAVRHAVAGANRGEIVALDHLDGPTGAAHMRTQPSQHPHHGVL
ncbi:hypothetical protein, partial [Brevundimonas sp. UBA7534]|uniref:hypothetical protein n=1 Tax=Brevundimonas sp. UBA7534 TaxID=1946138 RepID=UPI0032E40153